MRGARANSPAPELPERPLFGTQSEEATGSYGSQRVVDAVEKRSLAERESVNSVLEVCDCCSAYCRRSKPVPSAGSDDRLVPVSVNSPAGRQRQQSLLSRHSVSSHGRQLVLPEPDVGFGNCGLEGYRCRDSSSTRALELISAVQNAPTP